MKKILFTVLSICLCMTLFSQEEKTFTKKGKILVESGYGILGGYSSGTGINILAGDETISSIGANIGAFVTENFALKLNLGLLAGDVPSITSLTAGGKYYISGKAPVELRAGILDINSQSFAIGSLTVGYAAKLAQNVYLEPSAGLFMDIGNGGDGSGNVVFNVSFAMIL